ncbi:MAG: ABC transporter ATP-binding protein, partial [Culicoidibacterales bacterium]
MLKIQHVSKSFGTKKVVDDFSFTMKPGSPYGLLGRNGAGKTTTIKMILGLVEPDEGTILYNGEPFNRSKHSLGYMPEERGLYLNARIDEQLVYFAKLEGKRHVQSEIDMWLERFELTDYKQKKAQELSKGNKQKVQLIATLLHDPEIIILDEPFSGLDPVNADLFTTIIQEQVQQ